MNQGAETKRRMASSTSPVTKKKSEPVLMQIGEQELYRPTQPDESRRGIINDNNNHFVDLSAEARLDSTNDQHNETRMDWEAIDH